MVDEKETSDVKILTTIISALEQLEPEDRKRLIQTVSIFFDPEASLRRSPRSTDPLESRFLAQQTVPRGHTPVVSYSEDLGLTPKEFMLEKEPRTDVERIACLAYYLTHYRDTPHFKTLELSKLNTDAAQPKFANAANASNNAQKMGYLVPASKGRRQLSAGGEKFVQAMPDIELAKKEMLSFRPRRRSRKVESKAKVKSEKSNLSR